LSESFSDKLFPMKQNLLSNEEIVYIYHYSFVMVILQKVYEMKKKKHNCNIAVSGLAHKRNFEASECTSMYMHHH